MNKANIFMNAGWVGFAGGLIAIIAKSALASDGIALSGSVVAVLAGWVMLFTRNADEYTRGLWNSAASLAFAALLILFVALPLGEGFYDGLREGLEDREGGNYKQDIPSSASIGFAIAAFYVGLFWKRWRGEK